jgi:DNA-binding MarR family transcriptional regulator
VLGDEGFAEWAPNPRHRRAKLLQPTQQARDAIRRVAELQHPWSDDIAAAVGDTELRALTRSIQSLLAAIQDRPPGE